MSKIRYGFVSNSSSSSFILPVDGNSKEVSITIPLSELTKMFSSDYYEETSIRRTIETESDLRSYIIDDYLDSRCIEDEDLFFKELKDDDYANDIYYDVLKMINNGKVVLMGSVSYHDQGLETMLKKLGAKISDQE